MQPTRTIIIIFLRVTIIHVIGETGDYPFIEIYFLRKEFAAAFIHVLEEVIPSFGEIGEHSPTVHTTEMLVHHSFVD